MKTHEDIIRELIENSRDVEKVVDLTRLLVASVDAEAGLRSIQYFANIIEECCDETIKAKKKDKQNENK